MLGELFPIRIFFAGFSFSELVLQAAVDVSKNIVKKFHNTSRVQRNPAADSCYVHAQKYS